MIEANEYVRTKDGHIAKYIEKLEKDEDVSDAMLFDNYIYEKYKHIRYSFLEKIIVKHSKQLIDLIEVGDIVNGMQVLDIYKPRDLWEPIEIRVDSRCMNFILTEDIKTILTKEIYMANCYKVGGEDE